jgi:hypothetical protein
MNFSKIVILIVLFFSVSVATQAQTKKVKNLEFQSNTRGYQEKILISNNKVHLVRISTKGKIDTTFSLSQKDWVQLNKLVKGINLKNIAVLKAPTSYSHTDAARASSITINTESDSYTSSTFDNYNAPKELLPLIKKISDYAGKIKE